MKKRAIEAVKYYGVGTCGPSGFYGTLDVHLELEKEVARILGTEAAIVYSQSFAAISSVIPSFSKQGDFIVADEGVNMAIQQGIQISRSHVYWFKHNDMEDLERVLEEIRDESIRLKRTLTRRFIIIEGLYAKSADVPPLRKVLELKHRFKYRLIVDESLSIGTLGPRGLGVAEHFGVANTEIDVLLGSFSGVLGSAGGFCAGSVPVVDHQRLSSQAYCFSASLPGLMACAALEAFREIEANPSHIAALRQNVLLFKDISLPPRFVAIGDRVSPLVFLRLAKRLASRSEEVQIIRTIVKEARSRGILLAEAVFLHEERVLPPPSVKICISAGFSLEQVAGLAGILSLILACVS